MPVEFRWVDLGNGRSRYVRVREPEESKRANFPCPRIFNDRLDEPVQSPADGKFYESKSALRATYRPDGNPHGLEYTEVGNETTVTPWKKIAPDEKADREAVQKAIVDIENGNAPEILTTKEFPLQ